MSSAVAHFRTLCCLRLPPRIALIEIARAVREIIPAAWTRIGRVDSKLQPTIGYGEHPDFVPLYLKNFDHYAADPTALLSLLFESIRTNAIGMLLDRQGHDYLQSRYYREFERPLDSCWLLDAAIYDGPTPIGSMGLTRPRSARPFTSDDAAKLDALRPWIAHAIRDHAPAPDVAATLEGQRGDLYAGAAIRRAWAVVDRTGRLLFQTSGAEHLFYLLDGTAENWRHKLAIRKDVPSLVRQVVQVLVETAHGEGSRPPRAIARTPWGLVVVEASWLVPANTDPMDVASHPLDVPVAVHLELLEHATARVARVLREHGVSPAQVRVGVRLALGKPKPVIAKELGLKLSTVEDAARKLYERLGIHTAGELGTLLWTADGNSAIEAGQ